jgi:hypothetical protein
LTEVAKYIDADRVHAKLLLDADFLVPVYPRQEAGKRMLAFNRSDADDFLTWLMDGANVLENERDGAFSIPRAAKRVPCGAMDIVRLIRDKRLPWVGRRSDQSGYLSIRVRPDQVRPLVFPDIGISVREAATRLDVAIGITRNLMNFGLIKTRDGKGINYKRETYIVDPSSIDEFKKAFVSLSELVPEWGPTRLEARSALLSSGIIPATSSYDVGKVYFLRSDLHQVEPKPLRSKRKKRPLL